MYRGTTPTITFHLPIDGSSITALNLSFAQKGEIVLEKALSDCTAEGNTLRVTLTEQETLLFDARNGLVEMQLRVGCGEVRMASNIMRVSIEKILKDGCLE